MIVPAESDYKELPHLLSNLNKDLEQKVVVFVFNNHSTAMIIKGGQGHILKSHPIDWRGRGLNLQPLLHRKSGLSFITLLFPLQIQLFIQHLLKARKSYSDRNS